MHEDWLVNASRGNIALNAKLTPLDFCLLDFWLANLSLSYLFFDGLWKFKKKYFFRLFPLLSEGRLTQSSWTGSSRSKSLIWGLQRQEGPNFQAVEGRE